MPPKGAQKKVSDYSNLTCPVCSTTRSVFLLRSDANIYQCSSCSHSFTDSQSIVQSEEYGPDYYEKAHQNWFENPDIKLFSWIRSVLPTSITSVLDVGCGKGAFLKYMKINTPSAQRLLGVDYSPNESKDGVEFIMGDAATVAGNETFDAVVSLAVIEHVPDPVGFAKLMADRCKLGGHVVIMTVNDDSLVYRVARLMYRLGMKTPATRLYSAHHLQHFTLSSFRSTIEKAGLQIVSVHTRNAPLVATDIPDGSFIKRTIFKIGLVGLYYLGAFTGTAYLQTAVARKA